MERSPRTAPKDIYVAVGHVVVHAAWTERSIWGVRTRLDGDDAAARRRASRAPVTTNIDEALRLLRLRDDYAESVAELIERLEVLREMFRLRNHLVHGLPDTRTNKDRSVIWRKADQDGRGGWSYEHLDLDAVAHLGLEFSFAPSNLTRLVDEILPRVIIVEGRYADGRTMSEERLVGPNPRPPAPRL